ncbi:MAG: SH3 domain-containing protein [Anaerolineales bacterium]|nr:SH3 domain-containing protein [Anaerolineales bacterium]
MKNWLILIFLTLITLTACAAPSSASPTPTIVRLDRSALTPTTPIETVADIMPPSTSTPTAAATSAAAKSTATATLEPEPQATLSPTATTTPEAAQAQVVAAGLNVREGPGVSYAAVGTVAQGDTLDITSVSADGNWLQIVTKAGKSGWISSQPAYTRILGSLENVKTLNVERSNVQTANTQPATQSGGKLIFTTRSGGDLYSVNADGTDLQKLTSGVIDPVVSPMERRLPIPVGMGPTWVRSMC